MRGGLRSDPGDDGPQRDVVCILGLDTVRRKTLYQTRWLSGQGFRVKVLAMHRDTGSHTDDSSAEITTLESGPLARVIQTLRYLAAHRRELHHVELYVGGRFAFVHALLTRLLRIPLLVIERGDILLAQKRVYGAVMRLSIRWCYRLADRIWYREVYMERLFAQMGRRNAFLLPNAVPVPDEPVESAERDLDLLWLNRLIPERRPDEFARVIASLAARRSFSAAVVGLSADPPHPSIAAMEDAVVQSLRGLAGVSVTTFTEPDPYFARARFFVLHGEIVFANFALLEAMARGVVPVVSRAEGAELIVQDGVNGIVYRPDEAGLEAALTRALDTDAQQWRQWSLAARQTVVDRFSVEAWGRRLLQEYDQLAPRPPSALAGHLR